ncbi:MAG: hypothetical protein HYU80_00110 [Candidatus Blackburnbacteria bacterium]|nr:hypothetical protein [Candidatus Blackburnbacteria bacterium]
MSSTPEFEKPTLPPQGVETPEELIDTGAERQEFPSELEGYIKRVEHPTSQPVTNNNGQVVFTTSQDSSSVLQVPVPEEKITGKQTSPVEDSEHWFIAGWKRLVAKALFTGTRVLYPTHGWGTA